MLVPAAETTQGCYTTAEDNTDQFGPGWATSRVIRDYTAWFWSALLQPAPGAASRELLSLPARPQSAAAVYTVHTQMVLPPLHTASLSLLQQ